MHKNNKKSFMSTAPLSAFFQGKAIEGSSSLIQKKPLKIKETKQEL
jgi:hypothetical protein